MRRGSVTTHYPEFNDRRGKDRSVAAIAATIACVFGMAATGAYAAQVQAGAKDARQQNARDFIAFSTTFTSDCMLHQAQLRRIANTHPNKAIRVVLWTYTGKTRSQGRSEKVLAPGGAPQPLGCDGTSGLSRHWEIAEAEFVEPGAGQ